MQLTELIRTSTPAYQVRPVVLARLPYPISANVYWRTRVIFVGGKAQASTYVSKEAGQFRESVAWLLKQQGVRSVIKGRVQVDIRLLPNCPQDWKRRAKTDPLWWSDTVRRLDLDNCRKVVTDALKGIAIEDDVQVWREFGEVLEPIEGEDACVILQLSRLVKDNPQQEIA